MIIKINKIKFYKFMKNSLKMCIVITDKNVYNEYIIILIKNT